MNDNWCAAARNHPAFNAVDSLSSDFCRVHTVGVLKIFCLLQEKTYKMRSHKNRMKRANETAKAHSDGFTFALSSTKILSVSTISPAVPLHLKTVASIFDVTVCRHFMAST